MTFIPKDPLFIGVDFASSKVAFVKKKGKGWVFPKLAEFSEEILATKEETIAVGIPTREVLIKNLTIPLKGEKEIRAAFEFQVEPILPYPLDKCIVDYVKSQEKEQGSSLTCFSIKKETLAKYLKLFSFEPNFVTTTSLAIAALVEELPSSSDPFFFVHIGKEEGTFALFEKGKILSARFFDKERMEAEKTFLAMSTLYKNKKIEIVYLISEDDEWTKILLEITGKKVELPTFPNLPLSEENLKKYGLSIGIALASAKKLPNFRQKEFNSPFSFQKFKKPILVSTLLLATLFGSFFTLGNLYVNKKREEVFSRFRVLLKEEEPTSLYEMESRLQDFQKKTRESPDLYPLVPIVPKISDFLAWITAEFPNVFKIEDFRYQIAKRPDFTNKDEPYTVMIDMTVTIDNASVAEAIRTLLSAANPFVDNKKEFGWEIEKGKYHATFYLKDKTRYS